VYQSSLVSLCTDCFPMLSKYWSKDMAANQFLREIEVNLARELGPRQVVA
jgi:hypothetical protein